MNRRFVSSLFAILISTLACGPVIAISWNEFLLISVLFAILLGPPIYKFLRRVEEFLKHKAKNK